MTRSLPEPGRERWQPLRAGLVDLFYYDQEEFWFRDGRLLLRGNNGTGKSKVLALTLPFLLDGDLSPSRVEPDADPNKRMEWNLLLGGEHPHDERLGYVWLEFGRRDTLGEPVFCTIGCGMKAVSGRGIASHWFFRSDQRVGAGLALVDGAGIALTRDRLEDTLGARGAVYRTAREYRRAVDETLFGLGEERYRALVDLLIRIRAPQLSKRPNERALSDALTGALAPLDPALVADVADAFRGLEDDRHELQAMVEARDAAAAYLDTYRRYAQIACRRRAALPRQAQSVFDRVSRDLAEAETAHGRAQLELEAAGARLRELRGDEERLRARERALRESPEARSARELERAAADAREAGERVTIAGTAKERAEERLSRRRSAATAAGEQLVAAQTAFDAARATCMERATEAGVIAAFGESVERALSTQPAPDADELRRRAGGLVAAQQRAIAHLETLLAGVADSERALVSARARHDELLGEAASLAERHASATSGRAAAARELLRSARTHLDAATELAVVDPPAVLAALELWTETQDGPNPLAESLAAAGRAAAATLARTGAALDEHRSQAERIAAELDAAIASAEAGEHSAPPAPHTRDPEARADIPGAPLWQLVDFRPGVPEERRAGLEAALEAAGILDAWVNPAGRLVRAGTHDSTLVPAGAAQASGGRLADVLEPALDAGDARAREVGPEAVRAVLEAVALEDEGSVWVTEAGAFRNGIVRGEWGKPAAEFIGRGAREAARRALLAALREQREDVAHRLRALEADQARLDARREELEHELASAPADGSLREAHAELVAVATERVRLDERLAAAAARTADAAQAREDALRLAREVAEDLHLPADPGALRAVQAALEGLRFALEALWPALREHARAAAAASEAAAEVAAAEEDARAEAAHLSAATREAAERTERHATLADTVGAAVAELQRRLATVAGELRDNEHEREIADLRRSAAQREEGAQDSRRKELAAELERAADRRRGEVDGLRRFATTGLIMVALPEAEPPADDEAWTVTAALRLARQIEQALGDVEDADHNWERAQKRANDELGTLADALRRHGNNASARLQEEGIVVDVMFRGRSASVPALAGALADEVADRRRLLDEREREILENHLVNEVASTLQELISSAEQQVARMNAELAHRPTSTGMRLRMRWRAASHAPAGLPEARERLLRQTADAWSEDDRVAVGAFLQARIQEVRAREVHGTWLEHLTEALDYRAWHHFAIERHQAGQWRPASGPASSGERVLAASIPLFAAASSYYASAASPWAPRLVMLDEAFAGVDDDSRAKCLGLLAAFDLDVVMTSEREWGCYPEVPGLAIAQLARIDGVAAVLVSHWEWDGAARVAMERPLPEGAPWGVAGPAA